MGLKGIWEQERLQRLDEIAERQQKVSQKIGENRSERSKMSKKLTKELQEFGSNLHKTGLENKKQRQTENSERRQEMSQKMADFRREDIQRQNEVQQMHQTALEDKRQRQNEIAKRKEYVWGS
ncbi:MAG: hypothetical protein MGG11_07080 [Trichodesmium sp. MAG_R03]|nr:hypothetical protein [Trichodesmium sp. MAG_R03]